MSAAGITLVKNEAEIIDTTVRHMLTQVDHVFAWDNLSEDGSGEIMRAAGAVVLPDPEFGHYQGDKMTRLARQMAADGFDWVIPFDADEIWYAENGRPIRDWLPTLDRGIQTVQAEIYNHVATAEDIISDMRGMGWRTVHPLPMGKVAVRAREDIVIGEGNHDAWSSATGLRAGGLKIRHFPIRTVEQFIRKARNGAAVLGATTLDPSIGAHWRQWGQLTDDQLHEVFEMHYFSADPTCDHTLVYDPAPIGR